ncbi:hypothetical protein K2173_007086 [Erythroxylum novogranatense]|uniref:SHSP domain-containing protein n=1 Tax=Erythroxylum novogranatense TaxID=1862640 RepID=A0AAV8T5X1_9ROSI|nr:hypothetical protein K2173_007086 [Erythroxylum novogranatense]
MELELGLKITRTRDDVTTSSDLRVTKDQSGPVFFSRETDTMFILIIHLKGFRKENIDIKINEDGSQIAINGQKPVEELSLVGWIMHKKDVKLRTFKKVFQIPDGVILDRISAKFDVEESVLTIIMPKLAKGICGAEIEEVKEEEFNRGKAEGTEAVADRARGEQAEPKTEEVQKNGEVSQKEIAGGKPDATEVVANKFPSNWEGKAIEKEAESIGTSIKSEEIDQIVKQEVGPEAMTEVSRPFPESDKDKRVQEEKLEGKRARNKEEKEKLLEAKINEISDKMEAEAQVMPERGPGSTIPEKPAVENSRELGKATPGNAEYPATSATFRETSIMEAEKEIEQPEKFEPRPAEENQGEKRPHFEGHPKQQKLPQRGSSQEEKPEEHIDEPKSLESVKEKEQDEAPRPPYLPKADDNQEQETENEIKEATTDRAKERVDENASTEGKHKDRSVSKRKKLCPPLFCAGSAVLLSFVVVIINIIRVKRK